MGAYLPRLLLALGVFLIGVLIAPIIRGALRKAFNWVNLETLAEKSGVNSFLSQGGIKQNTSGLLVELIFWFFIFSVLLLSLDVAGLNVAGDIFEKIFLYIPRVVIAVAILIFGSLIAKFIRGFVAGTLSHLQQGESKWMSTAAYLVFMVFVVFMALEQLEIGGDILTSAFQLLFGSLCLALAIAFGLGGKDVAAQWLSKTFKK